MVKRQPKPTISVPNPPGSKFAELPRYGVSYRADPNSYAVCVPYFKARSAPVHDDQVHVRRIKTADGLHEDTIRVVKVKGKKVSLVCEEPVPKGYKDKEVAYPSKTRSETVEIRGLVVGRFEARGI
jgi:hypothetical protein